MLSKNLTRYRKRAGMTQKEVAEKLHIPPKLMQDTKEQMRIEMNLTLITFRK